MKYFRKGKKMGDLVLVGHTSHNSWTHNLKKALELLFARPLLGHVQIKIHIRGIWVRFPTYAHILCKVT